MNKAKLLIIAISLPLSACLQVNDNPKQVAHNYWSAITRGDHETARKLVSSNSQQDYENYISLPSGSRIPVDHVELDEEYATVASVLNPAGESPDDNRQFDTVLVLEEGKWKIDAQRTQLPLPKTLSEKQMEELADQLSESMQKNIESIDETMAEGMQMLNEVLREGSNEMGNSLLKGMEELNQRMRESIDKMKQRRNRDSTPDKDKGEGLL